MRRILIFTFSILFFTAAFSNAVFSIAETDMLPQDNNNEAVVSRNIITSDGLMTSYSASEGSMPIVVSALEQKPEKPEYMGYIVEYKEKPVIEIKKGRDKIIKEKEAAAKTIEREIAKDVAFYDIPGHINKFFKQADLSKAKNELEAEKAGAKTAIASQKAKIKSLHSRLKADKAVSKVLSEHETLFSGIALNISDGEAKEIEKIEYVKRVTPNHLNELHLMDAAPLINATLAWQLIDSNGLSVTGRGIKIAIIDTGVNYTHPDLGGCTQEQFLAMQCTKVIGGYDFSDNDDDPMDYQGHGTHVASTAAGRGALFGIAPDAQIVAYKVFPWATDDVIISAIERAVDPNQDGDFSDHYDIISMSLGYMGGTPDDPVPKAADEAADAGVVVVVSAGNSGPWSQSIGCPGCARKVITVGATYKKDYEEFRSDILPKQNQITYFSSRGPVVWTNSSGQQAMTKPDVVAPGAIICAARHDEIFPEGEHKYYYPCMDESHVQLAGTSMSAPIVSGAAALIKQAHPDWSPEQIKTALKSTATDLGYDENTQGAGLINVTKAVGMEQDISISPEILYLDDIPTSKLWSETRAFTMKNSGSEPATFALSADTGSQWISVRFSMDSVAVEPGSEQTFELTLTADNDRLPSRAFYNGKIIAESATQTIVTRIKDRISVEPGKVDFGIYLPDRDSWNSTAAVAIRNIREDIDVVYNVSFEYSTIKDGEYSYDLPEYLSKYITITSIPKNITIASGSNVTIHFDIHADYLPNAIYEGRIVFTSDMQEYKIPFIFTKYYILNISFSEMPYYFYAVGDVRVYINRVVNNNTIFYLDNPVIHDIVTYYLSKDDNRLYHVIKEGIQVKNLTSIFVNRSEAVNKVELANPSTNIGNFDILNHTYCEMKIAYNEYIYSYLERYCNYLSPAYFSNISNNYTIEVLAMPNLIRGSFGINIYDFVDGFKGVYNDKTLFNKTLDLKTKKILYHLNNSHDSVFIFYYWIALGMYSVRNSNIFSEPYENILFYNYLDYNDSNYRFFGIETMLPGGLYNSPIYEKTNTPDLVVNFLESESYFVDYYHPYYFDAARFYNKETIHIGIGPEFWYGNITNFNGIVFKISPYKGWALFPTQAFDIRNHPAMRYDLFYNGEWILNNTMYVGDLRRGFSGFKDLQIQKPSGNGLYSFIMKRDYPIGNEIYYGTVNATFDTLKPDSSPPSFVYFNLESGNDLTDHITNITYLKFGIDPNGGSVAGVSVSYLKNSAFVDIPVSTSSDGYSAPIPNDISGTYTIRITAMDDSDNILEYTFEVPVALSVNTTPSQMNITNITQPSFAANMSYEQIIASSLQLELLRTKLVNVRVDADKLADSAGAETAARLKEISGMLRSAISMVDAIKKKMLDNIDDISAALPDVREDIESLGDYVREIIARINEV